MDELGVEEARDDREELGHVCDDVAWNGDSVIKFMLLEADEYNY